MRDHARALQGNLEARKLVWVQMNSRSMRLTLLVSLPLLSLLAGRPGLVQAQVLTSTIPPEPADESSVAACKTDLRLSGSVYNPEHPERSMAVFEVPSSHASAVYRLGARVGAFELVAVVPRGAILRSSEGECWLRLVGDPGGGQRQVAVKPEPQRTKAKKTKRSKSSSKNTGAAVVIGGAR
jgi:hypothetical protein